MGTIKRHRLGSISMVRRPRERKVKTFGTPQKGKLTASKRCKVLMNKFMQKPSKGRYREFLSALQQLGVENPARAKEMKQAMEKIFSEKGLEKEKFL